MEQTRGGLVQRWLVSRRGRHLRHAKRARWHLARHLCLRLLMLLLEESLEYRW